MRQEYLKHLIIRTPLQEPSQKLQSLLAYRKLITHPELKEVYLESARIDNLMGKLISTSSNCIDIGAHLGSVLSKIARLAPKGEHIAFEAIPYKVRWLKEKFPEVQIHEVALTDTEGETKFYLDKQATAFSSMKPRKSENTEKIVVNCNTLDNLIPPNYKIDFIKIDVEGAELFVLKGAKETLTKYHPTLLFECAKSLVARFGVTPVDIFDYLTEEHGYSIFLIKDFLAEKQPLTAEQFKKSTDYPFQGFNFVAQ